MNALIVFSTLLAASQAGLIASPYYAAGLPYAGVPVTYTNGAPVATVAAAPVPAPVAIPQGPVSSQYQAQDELGNINYGYSNINSAKTEVGNAYGGVTGSYSYVDANGIPQRVDYIADGAGFRVRATNLPVAPSAVEAVALEHPVAPVYTGVAPAPVEDTPEVAAAKAEFAKVFEEAANRAKRSTPAATEPLVLAAPAPVIAAPATPYGLPLAYNQGLPLAYNNLNLAYTQGLPLAYNNLAYNLAPAAAAVTYAAEAPVVAAPAVGVPAAREAVLTKIQLNPGHAVAYRVD